MKHITVVIGLILTMSQPLHASDRLVHRWTDAKGRIHYGDARAASMQPQAKLVEIHSPISVVHNDQPRHMPKNSNYDASRHTTSQRVHHITQPHTTMHECELLREQLRTPHPQAASLTDKQYDYNERCIKGHYYGKAQD
jgi:hypothetical protein